MSDADNKARNREIAENEAERQTTGDIRVSGWAIAVAVVLCARDCGVGRHLRDDEIEQAVDDAMWHPDYVSYQQTGTHAPSKDGGKPPR